MRVRRGAVDALPRASPICFHHAAAPSLTSPYVVCPYKIFAPLCAVQFGDRGAPSIWNETKPSTLFVSILFQISPTVGRCSYSLSCATTTRTTIRRLHASIPRENVLQDHFISYVFDCRSALTFRDSFFLAETSSSRQISVLCGRSEMGLFRPGLCYQVRGRE